MWASVSKSEDGFYICKVHGMPGYEPGNYLRLDLMLLKDSQYNYEGSDSAGVYLKDIHLNQIGNMQ